MNKAILMGRLTRDPEVRYSAGENPIAIARYTLAVDRRFRRDGENNADFISCVVFGKGAEFTEKYFRQGLKIVISGRIQTGSYTNKDGQKVYTTEVVVEEQDFAESKSAQDNRQASSRQTDQENDYQGGNHQAPPQNGYQGGGYQAPPQNSYQGGGYQAPPQNGYQAPPQNGYQGGGYQAPPQGGYDNEFMNIPEGLDEELPFN
ncbi:MAG TPA: single-stranded DNA-binding protein [Candidatus Blautia faecavium]|uniref:Single-stranded DNA-binding protein n=1 Tax=Candidatus Blautia faecavium TaxID=2838487 RepID=A0A9D2LTZ4_9FIRM|nr:single-stranded DNA-binding protein [Candidatus Blautia faecavium]